MEYGRRHCMMGSVEKASHDIFHASKATRMKILRNNRLSLAMTSESRVKQVSCISRQCHLNDRQFP